jgi:hypothetical protein
MEALGLRVGPAFPAQQPLSADSIRRIQDGYRRSGIHEWVDWSEALWEDARTASRPVAAAAR